MQESKAETILGIVGDIGRKEKILKKVRNSMQERPYEWQLEELKL